MTRFFASPTLEVRNENTQNAKSAAETIATVKFQNHPTHIHRSMSWENAVCKTEQKISLALISSLYFEARFRRLLVLAVKIIIEEVWGDWWCFGEWQEWEFMLYDANSGFADYFLRDWETLSFNIKELTAKFWEKKNFLIDSVITFFYSINLMKLKSIYLNILCSLTA